MPVNTWHSFLGHQWLEKSWLKCNKFWRFCLQAGEVLPVWTSGMWTAFSFHKGASLHTALASSSTQSWQFVHRHSSADCQLKTGLSTWIGRLRTAKGAIVYQNIPDPCPVWRFLVSDPINTLVFQAFCKRLLSIGKRNHPNMSCILPSILSKPGKTRQ